MSASRKICFACGAACSAARFMPTSSSSSCGPMPSMRSPVAAVRSLSGSVILIAAFFRNPSGLPVEATALVVLTFRASLSPADILSVLRLVREFVEARPRSWSKGFWAAAQTEIRNKLMMRTRADPDIGFLQSAINLDERIAGRQ